MKSSISSIRHLPVRISSKLQQKSNNLNFALPNRSNKQSLISCLTIYLYILVYIPKKVHFIKVIWEYFQNPPDSYFQLHKILHSIASCPNAARLIICMKVRIEPFQSCLFSTPALNYSRCLIYFCFTFRVVEVDIGSLSNNIDLDTWQLLRKKAEIREPCFQLLSSAKGRSHLFSSLISKATQEMDGCLTDFLAGFAVNWIRDSFKSNCNKYYLNTKK